MVEVVELVVVGSRLSSSLLEFFEGARIGEEFAGEPPRLFGGVLERGGRLAAEQVERRQKVVRAAAALQARDELQQDAVDAVAQTRLVPLELARVLLALVQQQRLRPPAVVVPLVHQRPKSQTAANTNRTGVTYRLIRGAASELQL